MDGGVWHCWMFVFAVVCLMHVCCWCCKSMAHLFAFVVAWCCVALLAFLCLIACFAMQHKAVQRQVRQHNVMQSNMVKLKALDSKATHYRVKNNEAIQVIARQWNTEYCRTVLDKMTWCNAQHCPAMQFHTKQSNAKPTKPVQMV